MVMDQFFTATVAKEISNEKKQKCWKVQKKDIEFMQKILVELQGSGENAEDMWKALPTFLATMAQNVQI